MQDEILRADTADDALVGPGHPVSALKAGVQSLNGVAVAGVDGYLFIGNGANNWERQFLGELPVPSSWLEGWARLFEARQAEAAGRGKSVMAHHHSRKAC